MAVVNGYCTLAELKGWRGVEDTVDDADLELAINAASRHIDRLTRRRFYKDGAPSSRVFREANGSTVYVDDIADTTGLVIKTDTAGDGTFATTWTSADYELAPLNGFADGEAWPYTAINASGSALTFPTYGARPTRVQVTALWGWPAVPEPVHMACLILAQRLYRRRNTPEGVAGVGELGVVRLRSQDVDVEALLAPYSLGPVIA